jgi:hypothetical protein
MKPPHLLDSSRVVRKAISLLTTMMSERQIRCPPDADQDDDCDNGGDVDLSMKMPAELRGFSGLPRRNVIHGTGHGWCRYRPENHS